MPCWKGIMIPLYDGGFPRERQDTTKRNIPHISPIDLKTYDENLLGGVFFKNDIILGGRMAPLPKKRCVPSEIDTILCMTDVGSWKRDNVSQPRLFPNEVTHDVIKEAFSTIQAAPPIAVIDHDCVDVISNLKHFNDCLIGGSFSCSSMGILLRRRSFDPVLYPTERVLEDTWSVEAVEEVNRFSSMKPSLSSVNASYFEECDNFVVPVGFRVTTEMEMVFPCGGTDTDTRMFQPHQHKVLSLQTPDAPTKWDSLNADVYLEEALNAILRGAVGTCHIDESAAAAQTDEKVFGWPSSPFQKGGRQHCLRHTRDAHLQLGRGSDNALSSLLSENILCLHNIDALCPEDAIYPHCPVRGCLGSHIPFEIDDNLSSSRLRDLLSFLSSHKTVNAYTRVAMPSGIHTSELLSSRSAASAELDLVSSCSLYRILKREPLDANISQCDKNCSSPIDAEATVEFPIVDSDTRMADLSQQVDITPSDEIVEPRSTRSAPTKSEIECISEVTGANRQLAEDLDSLKFSLDTNGIQALDHSLQKAQPSHEITPPPQLRPYCRGEDEVVTGTGPATSLQWVQPNSTTTVLSNTMAEAEDGPLEIMVSEGLMEASVWLIQALATHHNIHCTDLPLEDPLALIIDGYTAVVLLAPEMIHQREGLKQVVKSMTRLAFKFRTIWIINLQEPSSYKRSGFVYGLFQSLSQFPCKTILRHCTNENLAAMVASVCSDAAEQAVKLGIHKRNYAKRPIFQCLEMGSAPIDSRSDITPDAQCLPLAILQQHCQFLQIFPTINFYTAAELLMRWPLRVLANLKTKDILREAHLQLRNDQALVGMSSLMRRHVGIQTTSEQLPKLSTHDRQPHQPHQPQQGAWPPSTAPSVAKYRVQQMPPL